LMDTKVSAGRGKVMLAYARYRAPADTIISCSK
jgi:hypothetical protein